MGSVACRGRCDLGDHRRPVSRQRRSSPDGPRRGRLHPDADPHRAAPISPPSASRTTTRTTRARCPWAPTEPGACRSAGTWTCSGSRSRHRSTVVITADPSASGAEGIQLADAALELGDHVREDEHRQGARPTGRRADGVRRAPAAGGLRGLGPARTVRVRAAAIRRHRVRHRPRAGDPFVDPAASPSAALPAELTLTTTTPEVAAYWRDGQRVDATLQVAPGAGDGLDLDSRRPPAITPGGSRCPEHVTVPATGLDVPLTIHVPSDAWRDIPVRITVRARTPTEAKRARGSRSCPARTRRRCPPEAYWPIPDSLAGRARCGVARRGGRSRPGTGATHWKSTTSSSSRGRGSPSTSPDGGPVIIDVDLAGDDPVPVVGTSSIRWVVQARTAADRVPSSCPVARWPDVHPGPGRELGPQTLEQAFVLPAPVDARFARLRSTAAGAARADPWTSASGRSWHGPAGALDRAARPRRSGPRRSHRGERAGIPDGVRHARRQRHEPADGPHQGRSSQRIAVGFADDRAAQITGLRWQDQAGSDPEARISTVGVEVAEDSPLGPWRTLGRGTHARGGWERPPFDLSEPTWARFVRLTLAGASDADVRPRSCRERSRSWSARPTTSIGRSSVNGVSRVHGASMRSLVPAPLEAAAQDVDVGDTADAARPIARARSPTAVSPEAPTPTGTG